MSHAQSEYIRVQAVKQVRIENKSPEEVIKNFGLHRSNIYKWLIKYDEHGFKGLESSKAKGPAPKLAAKEEQQLCKLLLKNPLQFQFAYALWTIEMISQLVERKFFVRYSSVQLSRWLKRLGISRQRP